MKKFTAGFIPFFEDENGISVFLQKRTKDAPTYPSALKPFGGGLEGDETIEQCLLREVYEELDYRPKGHQYIGVMQYPDRISHVYIERVHPDFGSVVKVSEGEYGKFFTELEVMNDKSVPADLFEKLPWLFANIRKAPKSFLPVRPTLSIHHVAIIVSDIELAKYFYVNVLGFRILNELYRHERSSWKVDLEIDGGTQLEMFTFPEAPSRITNPEALGLRHLAFHVDDVEVIISRLATFGFETEPIRSSALDGRRFTFTRDPDGLPIEFYE